ncbi:hypothetical protein MBLNU459_g1737t2 [Dothideomycetes sp. NU459]
MRLLNSLSAALVGLATLASAAKVTISIPASPPLLANPAALPPTTHATLLGAGGVHLDARLTRANTLVFKAVAPGSYLLDIHTRDLTFPPFRVDVTAAGAAAEAGGERVEIWQTFRGNEWENKGAKFGEAAAGGELVVTLTPSGRKEYFQKREGCEFLRSFDFFHSSSYSSSFLATLDMLPSSSSLWCVADNLTPPPAVDLLGFVKSPMVLMGLFSVGMIFGMPYLMENMDPETKAEFEEMQKKSPITGSDGAASQIQNFDLAAWMAGKSGGGPAKK